MTTEKPAWLHEYLELNRYAISVLGERGWALVCGYGRLMSGPYGGSYVSALPTADTAVLLDALAGGEEINVHLMHRHVSGNSESSRLRLVDGRLVMRFPDREELA